MSSEYGIRLKSIGANRLAVLSRARSLLQRSPAEVKAEFDAGRAVELARDVSRTDAERLAVELRSLGAEVEIYVTTQCYSDCSFHEHGKAYFPPGSEKWYPKHLVAMNEPVLYGQRADTRHVQYRFLWLRTFNKPIAVRVWRDDDGCKLRVVRLNGMGGYEPGVIEHDDTLSLTTDEWNDFLRQRDKAAFWDLPTIENGSAGCDGDNWVLEGLHHGRYHFVDRWCPTFESNELAQKHFVDCCSYLLKLSKLKIREGEVY